MERIRKMERQVRETAWIVPVLVAVIGGFMSILDSSIVNVALSTIMHSFNVDTAEIQWVVTVYMLAMASVIPLSGWAGERFGEKTIFIVSIILFTCGSLLCALSWDINVLIVSRTIQALGGGFLMPLMMTMCRKMVPKEHFAAAVGMIGVSMLLAPALGPTVGGYIVEYLGWQWIFTINIPVGIIGVFLAIIFLPQFPKSKESKLDIGGAVSAAAMLFMLLLALSKGSSWGWSSEAVVLLFFFSACSFVLFIYLELTSKHPLLDLHVFKHKTFTMANAMIAISTIGLYSALFYVPLFLQNIKGIGAFQTGLMMLPGALMSGIMMPVTSKLYAKVGPKPLSLFGIVLLAITTYLLHGISIDTPNGLIVFWMMLRGAGMAFAMMPSQTAALDSVPIESSGTASSVTNIISRVSGSFGIAILTSILMSRTSFHSAMTRWRITPSSPAIAGLMQKFSYLLGGNPAASTKAGASMLSGLISETAFVKGLDDVFIIASIIVIFGLIPALFLKPGQSTGGEKAFIE